MAEETEATPEAAPESGGGGGAMRLLVFALAFLLVAGASAGGTFFMLRNQAPPAETTAAPEGAPAADDKAPFSDRVLALDPFVVNVSGEGYPRYLKVKVAFELSSPEARDELKTRVAQVRDATILLLSSKRLDDVTAFEGKALLKDDLRARVEPLLEKGHVESVLFTEFVVQ